MAVLRDHPGRRRRGDPADADHPWRIRVSDARQIDLVYRVLDEQLVDVDGRRCGRVDDLEFEGDVGAPPRLYAILSGSGTWHRRVPRRLRPLAARVFGRGVVGRDVIRVPWEQVDDV